jgi:uncharacterized protein YbjT (DUF2867 family)
MTNTTEVAVMGAAGNVGGALSRLLLDRDVQVRALGRSPERLAALTALGAHPYVVNAQDATRLTDTFRGVDAAFTLLPYDPQDAHYRRSQARLGESIVEAIAAARVPRVVFLSSIGADLPSGTGPVVSLHEQEERLRELSGVDVLVLRPGSFFENFAHALPLIEDEGILADTVAAEVAIPMIATADVAAAAADALITREWTGVEVRELLGERDLSYAEAAAILGQALARPGLPYVQIPEADMEAALHQAGFSSDMARLQLELNRALSDGTVVAGEPRTSRNTTPTSFEAFAHELARTAQPA